MTATPAAISRANTRSRLPATRSWTRALPASVPVLTFVYVGRTSEPTGIDPRGRNSRLDMAEHKGLPVLAFASQDMWQGWLAKHGAASRGVWVKFAKKTAGV